MSEDKHKYADEQARKTHRVVQMEIPKHKEEYSLRECAAFQPWHVVLMIELDADDPEPVPYELFLRAPSPNDAQYTAYSVFKLWEHDHLDSDDYPIISTSSDGHYAEKLTEDQWDSMVKDMKKYPHKKAGMPDNPTIFRIIKPGWDKRSGLLKGTGRSIIVPDMATVKAVTDVHKKKKGK